MGTFRELLRVAMREPLELPHRLLEISRDLKLYGMMHEIFIHQQYYYFARGIKPKSVVVDIGAFMGETAIYFSQFENVSAVIAFEPIPATYERGLHVLSTTIPELRKKINYRNAAVRDSEGSVHIPKNYTGSGDTALNKAEGEGQKVPVTTLNKIFRPGKRYALKIDCEGDELLVLRKQNLSQVDRIVLEHSENTKGSIITLLKEAGFDIISSHAT